MSGGYTVPTCEFKHCTGHLGKFDDCVAEALWELSLDGADGDTGTVDFEGHFTLVLLEEPYTHKLNDQHEIEIPAGYHIVVDQPGGWVTIRSYESEAKAREVFAGHEKRFGAWDDQD